jgi:hypothetical protein
VREGDLVVVVSDLREKGSGADGSMEELPAPSLKGAPNVNIRSVQVRHVR